MTPPTCDCAETHTRRRIVLTGGPGAGKTAVLHVIRRSACEHVVVLNEAAGIVFGGGFPRDQAAGVRRAAQRAIFHVQRELEAAADEANAAIVMCDRGMVDGFAYWPGPDDFWSSVGTTREELFARYEAVIHMRVPDDAHGYGHQNPLRTESSAEAAAIDTRILQAWDGHARRFIIDATSNFLAKAGRVLEILRGEVPACCREHVGRAMENAGQ